MGLWEDITSWVDPTVDWVAEAIGYEDIDDIDFGFTAGEQLTSDVKSFFDSDTFGFIRKGAGALLTSQGLGGEGKTPLIQTVKQTKVKRPNFSGSRAMTYSPITGNPVNIGYQRPDVQSYLTTLAQNSYNQQMNNMFSQFLVPPIKSTGQKTVGLGSTQVKGISKKSRTTKTRS